MSTEARNVSLGREAPLYKGWRRIGRSGKNKKEVDDE